MCQYHQTRGVRGIERHRDTLSLHSRAQARSLFLMASSSMISRLVALFLWSICLRQLDLERNMASISALSFYKSSTSCSSPFSFTLPCGSPIFYAFLQNLANFFSLYTALCVTTVSLPSSLLTSSLSSSYLRSSIIAVVSLIHRACSPTLAINFWYFSSTLLPCPAGALTILLWRCCTLVCSCRFSFYFSELIFLLCQSAFVSLEWEAWRVSFLLRSMYRIFLINISNSIAFRTKYTPIPPVHLLPSPLFPPLSTSPLIFRCNPGNNYINNAEERRRQRGVEGDGDRRQLLPLVGSHPLELQQKLVHLQTVLMLTQLNSAYFEMQLSLHKTLSKVENKYRALKMKAFINIRHCKNHRYQFTQKRPPYLLPLLESAAHEMGKVKAKGPLIVLESLEATVGRVKANVQVKLRRTVQLLSRKLDGHICYGFHQLLRGSNENSTLKILSDKSSKIETIDSQKSKVFKRSAEKRVSRKSFSLEKSITAEKGQCFVPVKYQAQAKLTPPISSQASSIQPEEGISDLSKLLRNVDTGSGRDRRNLLTAGRQRKLLKSTSSKKYNASLVSECKQQKVKELQYLQRKYKKLIAQFNWFSERFLKVIEEQPI